MALRPHPPLRRRRIEPAGRTRKGPLPSGAGVPAAARSATFPASCLLALALSAALPAAPASGHTAEVPAVGPTYDCRRAHDRVAAAVCSDPALKRLDVEFVQAYQALRHQLPGGQQRSLQLDAIAFGKSIVRACGLPPAGARDAAATARAVPCVARAFRLKRAEYLARLSPDAAQEARRDAGLHIALQTRLAETGLVAAAAPVDGVYGPVVRDAIMRLQAGHGLPATGFMTDAAGQALLLGAPAASAAEERPSPTDAPRALPPSAAASGAPAAPPASEAAVTPAPAIAEPPVFSVPAKVQPITLGNRPSPVFEAAGEGKLWGWPPGAPTTSAAPASPHELFRCASYVLRAYPAVAGMPGSSPGLAGFSIKLSQHLSALGRSRLASLGATPGTASAEHQIASRIGERLAAEDTAAEGPPGVLRQLARCADLR